MTRRGWWATVLLIASGVLCLDFITGPYIMFPITFVIPVALAAWHLGPRPGVGTATALVVARFAIATTVDADLMPPWAALLNACIRLVVLVGLAFLVAKLAEQQGALRQRVQTLEGILPICAFCKKIRRPDGTWEQIESYVSERSSAKFSHGFCESCGRENYGEFFRAE